MTSYSTNHKITVSIPMYVVRGSGFDTHYEYEVKVSFLTLKR